MSWLREGVERLAPEVLLVTEFEAVKIGTWNLHGASPHGPRGAAQVNAMTKMGVDLRMLTEVQEDLRLGRLRMHFAVTRIDGGRVHWCRHQQPLAPDAGRQRDGVVGVGSRQGHLRVSARGLLRDALARRWSLLGGPG